MQLFDQPIAEHSVEEDIQNSDSNDDEQVQKQSQKFTAQKTGGACF